MYCVYSLCVYSFSWTSLNFLIRLLFDAYAILTGLFGYSIHMNMCVQQRMCPIFFSSINLIVCMYLNVSTTKNLFFFIVFVIYTRSAFIYYEHFVVGYLFSSCIVGINPHTLEQKLKQEISFNVRGFERKKNEKKENEKRI